MASLVPKALLVANTLFMIVRRQELMKQNSVFSSKNNVFSSKSNVFSSKIKLIAPLEGEGKTFYVSQSVSQ